MENFYLEFFLIFLVILLFAGFSAQTINYKREKGKRLRDLEDKHVFKGKNSLLNESERTLYNVLRDKLGDKYIVIPQVNLLSFIQVDNKFENLYEEIETLRKFTVDYLVVDSVTTEPKLVIELDGKSHEWPSKKNRDHYINTVCKKSKIPIKHIKVGENFENESANIRHSIG